MDLNRHRNIIISSVVLSRKFYLAIVLKNKSPFLIKHRGGLYHDRLTPYMFVDKIIPAET